MTTKIEWATNPDGSRGESWNPIRARRADSGKAGWFCTKISEGCEHCYAEVINNRFGTGLPYRRESLARLDIYVDQKVLAKPLSWEKPRRVFVESMGDLFHSRVGALRQAAVFDIIHQCPRHTFIVLTKRPEQMDAFECACGLPKDPNIWWLVTAENQRAANKRIPVLLDLPMAIRGVSVEPMLGPVDLSNYLDGLSWVICGGETGQGARPIQPEWVYDLRDQCVTADVPFFFKKWGPSGERLVESRLWEQYPAEGQ